MKKNKKHPIVCLFLAYLLIPTQAYAYLDPGTGSMLLSVIIGLMSTAYFAVRKIPALIRAIYFRITGKGKLLKKNHIVIYGETASYWGTFRPLLEEFGRRGKKVTYLTSSENDPCFSAHLPDCIVCKYIGTGNAAYTLLNFLEADSLVLTTPGVDVLQIRRSKGVQKYIHVLHSIGDIHYYKLFAFDYYDAVLCNGIYQVNSLRVLEKERGTTPKYLPVVGIPYFDGLVARHNSLTHIPMEMNCVIVAPTWGKLGMLRKYGSAIPKILADAGFHVIFRPHPQSYISEKKLLETIELELTDYPNIEWDKNPDGFPSLCRAALLVSDVSSVCFDYAFVFLRPVVTLEYEITNIGFEAFDIPHARWNDHIVEQLGRKLPANEINQLPAIVRELIYSKDIASQIQTIIDSEIVNFGHAAQSIVDKIIEISSQVEGD